MDDRSNSQLHIFLKELGSRTVGIVDVDGLVDLVLQHASLLKHISSNKESGHLDGTNLTMIFAEIIKQIYASISSYDFTGIDWELKLPWLGLAHAMSSMLKSAYTHSSSGQAVPKKRFRYNKQNNKTFGRRMLLRGAAEFDSPLFQIVRTLREHLSFFASDDNSQQRCWRCLSAASLLLENLVASAIDGSSAAPIGNLQGNSRVISYSSLFTMVTDLAETLLQSSNEQVIIVYPLLIVGAICLFSMPFYDSSSDLRTPLLRWMSVLEDFLKSPLSEYPPLVIDFFLITSSFLTVSNISYSIGLSTSVSSQYSVEGSNKVLTMLQRFVTTRLSSSATVAKITVDLCAPLIRFISLFILSAKLQRIKASSNSIQSPTLRSTNAPALTAAGAHCCGLPIDESCSVRMAIELASEIVKVLLQKEPVQDDDDSSEPAEVVSPVDLLLSELVRSGSCCCCFKTESGIISSLLKSASQCQRHQSSMLSVNLCIRIFLDYHQRSDSIQGQHESCPFYFLPESNQNDILAEYVSMPYAIFTSKVNLNQAEPAVEMPPEESCFQIARQILTLTSTSAFSTSSQARYFLFRYLVGPLFDWVLASCFNQTDLFISRKTLPVVLRSVENFLGEKDSRYFAEFASSSRLSCMSRLFEAGNGFCYIIGLIRILVRSPSDGSLTLSSEILSQLDVVKKVAVSTFLPAFYSVTKRLTTALFGTDEGSLPNLSISCNDLQIMSHCFFMLDESPFFAATFVTQQSTEAFINLLSGFEHYITRNRPSTYSKEFVLLFVYAMASLFRLSSMPHSPLVNTSTASSNIRFFPSHHEFYSLLRVSFDSFCALLTPQPPAVEHWCIIRDYHGGLGSSSTHPFDKTGLTNGELNNEDMFTSSVGELQLLIGQSDAAALSDGGSTAETDYEADEDEDDDNSIAKASDLESDGVSCRDNTFGSLPASSSSFVSFVGPRFYLALELVKVLCRFIRHCRNCIDPSCPTGLAELTCSLESVLAMVTQAHVDSFSHESIETLFDLIFYGGLHPFLLNTEHNWHTIQHLLFCLVANLGARHITPRHLCAVFRMTTNESVSLVSAATHCLTKLANLSDFRAPPFCLRLQYSSLGDGHPTSGVNLRSPLPVKWQPGKCCATICTWVYFEGKTKTPENSEHSYEGTSDPVTLPLCAVGCSDFLVSVVVVRRNKQYYDSYAEIGLIGQQVRHKLHLPLVRHRWHMLTLLIRDELLLNKDQYSVSVTAILDCEHVSTASSAWPVDELPLKQVTKKTVRHFSKPPVLVIGTCGIDLPKDKNNVTTKSSKGLQNNLPTSVPTDSLLLVGPVVFGDWLSPTELLHVFARLPAWLFQPLSVLLSWPVYPAMCVTPNIIDDNPRAFTHHFKHTPDFLTSMCLILRPIFSSSPTQPLAEFVNVKVQESAPPVRTTAQPDEGHKNGAGSNLMEVSGKIIGTIEIGQSMLSIVRFANFHNSALQVGGPDFLITWLSSLGSISHAPTCRHLLFCGIETVMTAIRHPHIYSRFSEMLGFDMLYQLLMLKIIPDAPSFLTENLVTILINASLSHGVLAGANETSDDVPTRPQFQVSNKNRLVIRHDACTLVQIPEIWSHILLNPEFLRTSCNLSSWRIVFSTVSLLVSCSTFHTDTKSRCSYSVSSSATFNRTIFSRMDFACRCFTILRSSVNQPEVCNIVLTSLGDFLLAMDDPVAVSIIADFLIALYPLSAFVVDIVPSELFPEYMLSHLYTHDDIAPRLSQSSRTDASFSIANFINTSLDVLGTRDDRRNSSTPNLISGNIEHRNSGIENQAPSGSQKARLSSSDPSKCQPNNLPNERNSVAGNPEVYASSKNKPRADVMVRLIEVLDTVLRKHPHAAFARLFRCIRPQTFLFLVGGGSEELIPSAEFSCRLLHTIWQSLEAAECRIASDLFLQEKGPILLSLQISRALGKDDGNTLPSLSLHDSFDTSHQSQLFTSLSTYYYEFLCRNVAALDHVTDERLTSVRPDFGCRMCGCRCSSLSAAVKTACPAKILLSHWWSVPAVELAVCSLFSVKSTPESRALLRLIASEFFLIYCYILPSPTTPAPVDDDDVKRVWSLIAAKLQLIFMLLITTIASVTSGGRNAVENNSNQCLNLENDNEQVLTCCLTYLLAVLSSNSSASTSTYGDDPSQPQRLAIDSRGAFLAMTNKMSLTFPELGIANHWLVGALKQFERICELVADSADEPQSLPLVKKTPRGPSVLVGGTDSHQTTSYSASTALSFTVSEGEEDEEIDSADDPNDIMPIFERSLTHMMRKQSGTTGRFVELIASHINRWPNAVGSADLAKGLLLFVSRRVDACGSNRSRALAADSGCLLAACSAAVNTKSIDMLFVAEILHGWLAAGTTALSLPPRQWQNAQAGGFIAAALSAYDVKKGPCLLPTQRLRLKEVISRLPAPTAHLPNNSYSQSVFGLDDSVATKVKLCCELLFPVADRITELNRSAREQHHSKRNNLLLPKSSEPEMKVRLKLIETIRRFAHPAAPMGDSTAVSKLYPNEWELDPVEGTLGVFVKLRRQALNLPAGKVYRQVHRIPSVPGNIEQVEAYEPPRRRTESARFKRKPSRTLARPTFPSCDCNDSAENPSKIERDWTYVVRAFGQQQLVSTAMHGFLSAILQILSTKSSDSGDLETRIDLSCQCTLVTPSATVEGEMFVTEDRVLFLSRKATIEDIYRQFLFNLHSGVPVLVTFTLQSVSAVYPRRYLLKENALEVFLASGRAYFFAFNPESVELVDTGGHRRKASPAKPLSLTLAHEVCESVQSVLLARCRLGTGTLPHPADLQVQWLKGRITNFEYIMLLNRAGGRSNNEVMQYPVFPWVLSDYSSQSIDLLSSSSYRDLGKQISLLEHATNGEEKVLLRYNQLQAEDAVPYHFPSLYSNSGIVAHYLVRIPPFTQACLSYQDGNFDIPDRTFSSFAATWSIADIKELLPEFFYLPEFLTNFCHLNLGVCQNGSRVWDVALPPWAGNSPRRFILVHRQALESSYVRSHLPKWIDLIFGYRQAGKAAVEALNVFHPSTYFSSGTSSELQSLLADPVQFAARQAQIRTYGQIPRQLFEFAHPTSKVAMKRSTDLLENTPDETSPDKSDMFSDDVSLVGISVGNYAGSHARLICVWQVDFPNDITANAADLRFADSNNLVVLLSSANDATIYDQTLLPVVAPQKMRRRAPLLTSAPPTGAGVVNWFSVEVARSLAGGFNVSTTKRIQSWSTGTTATNTDTLHMNLSSVSSFHAIPHHYLTCGPVHSSSHRLLLFGTSVGLILAFYYEIDELDLASDCPADRLPLSNKTPIQVLCAHQTAAAVVAIAVSDEFKFFVAGTSDGRCVFFDLNSLSFVRQVTVSNANGGTATSAISHLAISRTLGDVAIYCDTGYLTIVTVNGALVGQTTALKDVVSIEFSSCPEGTSVNSLLVVSANPPTLSFYCSWDLRLVRTIQLNDIPLTEQFLSGGSSLRRRVVNIKEQRPTRSSDHQQLVTARYSQPDSQLIAVLSRNSIAVYSNATPSAQAIATLKQMKISLIS